LREKENQKGKEAAFQGKKNGDRPTKQGERKGLAEFDGSTKASLGPENI